MEPVTAISWRSGNPDKRGDQRVNFGRTGAVAIDTRIGLFETDAGGERERLILREMAAQKAGDNVHAFIVEAAAQIGFTFDIDQAGFAKRCGRGDAHRLAKRISADFQNAEAVDLANAGARQRPPEACLLQSFRACAFR